MRHTDLKVLKLFIRLADVARIVSSKEGHDESHINDTKLGTKLWNVVDNITIRLTQKVPTQRKF